ncbi:transcription repressor OFP14-like [Lotus japonicus]|uniref:transcription repressor OFP14-like n=1 Tax=Lotus japonicus TaxID=34305 RepID=UPI002588961B|nr:transcription repressor OFP14-like [Lotus japonicus]
MPKNIQKSLHDYLSKIKTSPRSQIHLHLPSKKWILRGCKHPRTPSFSMDDKKIDRPNSGNNNNNNKNDDEATLADIDRFLFENFRTLYLGDDEKTHNTKRVSEEENHGKPQNPGPTSLELLPPDLSAFSRRFFVTRGAFSGSLLETGSSSSASTTARNTDDDSSPKAAAAAIPENCVAVLAPCAKCPYEEFKRSMEGVVEERFRNDESVDWDFMEELLSCYMNMNEKKQHKFVLAAFVDVIAVMRRQPLAIAPAKPRSVRTMRIGREIRKKTKEVTLEFESS